MEFGKLLIWVSIQSVARWQVHLHRRPAWFAAQLELLPQLNESFPMAADWIAATNACPFSLKCLAGVAD